MKKVLITGATDGIGLATAKLLVSAGHSLLIHGRSAEKLKHSAELLQQLNSQVQIFTYLADLADFNQVKQLVEDIKADHPSLDVIINNAGVLKTNQSITADGFDVRFVVNTITPYWLTQALIPQLSATGRIINLSSAAQAPIDLQVLLGKRQLADDLQVYAQSKLAITIWSQELAKSLSSQQVLLAMNPGSLLASKMVKEGFGLAGNDLSIGADILVRAALSPEFSEASGKYFDNDAKRLASPHGDASNSQKCQQLMTTLDSIVAQIN